MTINKINVIDLDKTLVSFDTFRELVKREIKNLNLKVIWLTSLRILRMIDSAEYKKEVQLNLTRKHDQDFFKLYAKEITQKLNQDVMKLIEMHTDENTTNILLSASSDDYVSELAALLKWKGKGSYFDQEGNYHHLHGKGKINWLEQNFPKDDFTYHFAISDGTSDMEMLQFFSKNSIVEN